MLTGSLPKQIDFRKLADQAASLQGSVALAAFARLTGMLAATSGEIGVSLQFSRGKRRLPLVEGHCEGEVSMICQVCLEPVAVKVDTDVRSLLVDNVDVLKTLALDDDGLVCAAARVDLVDLVEDDIIVSLPMVPRHPAGSCAAAPVAGQPLAAPGSDGAASTHRPFAGLADIRDQFKRSE
ncbi:MAG: YceD family protein [Pseudomonadota bacterium]